MYFSFHLIFSATLLRDFHVAFFLILSIYIVLGNYSFKRLLFLFILSLFVFTLRPTHFIIFFLIIPIYISGLFNSNKSSFFKYSIILISSLLRISALSFCLINDINFNLIERFIFYQNYSLQELKEVESHL